MGDIADLIIEGHLCSECGCCIDEPGGGIPRVCGDCLDDAASLKAEKAQSRATATATFQHCLRKARAAGLRLVRHNDAHYQIFGPGERGWLINIYPGNHRLYSDPKRPKAPRLARRMPLDWVLEDVVTAAIAAERKTP